MKDLKAIPRNAFSTAGLGISLPFEPEGPVEKPLGSAAASTAEAEAEKYDGHIAFRPVPKGHHMSWGHSYSGQCPWATSSSDWKLQLSS